MLARVRATGHPGFVGPFRSITEPPNALGNNVGRGSHYEKWSGLDTLNSLWDVIRF